MVTTLLIGLLALILALLSMISTRLAFLAVVFLYGAYPKFLGIAIGQQGFALTGSRVFLLTLLIAFLARAAINDPVFNAGLARVYQARKTLAAVFLIVAAKAIGNATTGRMDLGSAAALADEFMVSVFAFVVAVVYVGTTRDALVIFVCLAASAIVQEIAVGMEWYRGGSIFRGVIDIAYETASRHDLTAGRIRDGSYRAMGLTPNPLNLVSILCISLPGILLLIFRQQQFLPRAVGLIALLGFVPAIISTFARGGIAVALLSVGIFIYLIAVRRLERPLQYGITGLLLLTGSGALILFGTDLLSSLISFGGAEGMRSAQSRLGQIGAVAPVIADHLLFGVGFARNYDLLLDVGNIDSHILRTAIQGGLAAVLALLYCIYLGLRMSLSRSRTMQTSFDRSVAQTIAATIGVIALLMLVYGQHNTHMYFFVMLGAAASLSERQSGCEPESLLRSAVTR